MGSALLLAGGSLEAGVRFLAPQAPVAEQPLLRGAFTQPGNHRARTEAGEVTVHVNAQGFVDEEWPEPRKSDVGPQPKADGAPPPIPGLRPDVRVVLLGDSFVQAAQVELQEGLGRRLEAALRASGHPQAEVVSLGVPGAGTATALEVYRAQARELRADIVLLGFLVANDVLNNHPLLEGKDDKPFYALEGGRLVRTDAARAQASRGPGAWSHAWRWLARRWVTARHAQRKLAAGGGMPIDLRVHDPAPNPLWEEAWAVTGALLAQLATEARADGARFGVLLFPDGLQANARDREAARARWPDARGWDLTRAPARARSLAAPLGPTLDLLPALRDDPARYLPRDGHWTAAGHAAAAEATAAWLRSGGLDSR